MFDAVRGRGTRFFVQFLNTAAARVSGSSPEIARGTGLQTPPRTVQSAERKMRRVPYGGIGLPP
jgi:hypothetical protein